MKTYLNKTDAVCDLHGRGFTNDFHISDNDLRWIQEGIFIRVDKFAIMEYYKIQRHVVLGIVALNYNIKGILLADLKTLLILFRRSGS